MDAYDIIYDILTRVSCTRRL